MRDLLLAERQAYARLAQSVEHQTLNLRVVGSSPTVGANCSFPYVFQSPFLLWARWKHSFIPCTVSFGKQSDNKQKKKGNIAILS